MTIEVKEEVDVICSVYCPSGKHGRTVYHQGKWNRVCEIQSNDFKSSFHFLPDGKLHVLRLVSPIVFLT